MNDTQFESLRQFVAEKTSARKSAARDIDNFSNRRHKFIQVPYVSMHARQAAELASRGINDLLESNTVACQMFLQDQKMRDFLRECASIKNRARVK